MYSLHSLARKLRDGCESVEEKADFEVALSQLPQTDRDILLLYAQGFSPRDATNRLHITGNPQRLYTTALKRFNSLLGGD